MSIMAKTPSGYKKIGSAYLGEQPVDKVFNANGDVVYALQRELTGVPPLLFKGKEQSELLNYRICGNTETKQRDYSGSSPLTVPVHDGELYNYRIYGNTANGESVGDKTGNLFDMNTWANTITNVRGNGIMSISGNTVSITSVDVQDCYTVPYMYSAEGVYKILVKPNTNYRIQYSKSSNASVIILENGTTSYMYTSTGPITTHSDTTFLTLRMGVSASAPLGTTATISEFIISEGSGVTPYEPYGYKVPIAVTNSGTTSNETIYLPEPIKMVGSEAEYVDYYSQKQYFADGTNIAVTIPALPISTGTNTVTVNTTVQPSNVEVSTDENVSVGDLVTSGQHAGEYKVDVTVEGKNLLPNTAISQTINGVTFTVNTDGSVTCNNTATANSIFRIGIYLDAGVDYILSGCLIATNEGRIDLRKSGAVVADKDGQYVVNTTFPCTFQLTESGYYDVCIRIATGYTCDNLTFYPMIRLATIEDDTYEPYRTPVTTPIYLPEQIRKVGDEAEYIDYGERKQHRVRKNLLSNTATSQTINGVTFTVNSDGSVTCNGTASTAVIYIISSEAFLPPVGRYKLNGAPTGGGWNNNFKLDVRVSTNIYYPDTGNGIRFNILQGESITLCRIVIYSGCTCENLTFYPMIRKADIEDDTYEPYIENTDLDVTLPALPTIKGTNEMSVDTEVQPSRMDIKGRIKSLT